MPLDLRPSPPKDVMTISAGWPSFMTRWFTIQDILKNILCIVC